MPLVGLGTVCTVRPASLRLLAACMRRMAGQDPGGGPVAAAPSPLVLAVWARQGGAVQRLLEAGADPTLVDPSRRSAYQWALVQHRWLAQQQQRWQVCLGKEGCGCVGG
jgi:hypothetical protein